MFNELDMLVLVLACCGGNNMMSTMENQNTLTCRHLQIFKPRAL